MPLQLVTTAIDYTNGAPHIGHAYEKVLADAIKRFENMRGVNTVLLTGVDQHGQKIERAALAAGVAPNLYVQTYTNYFRELSDKLGIHYTEFVETTNPRHVKFVKCILTQLFEDGHIYRAKQKGWYSIREEQFLSDKDRDEHGGFNIDKWGEVEEREEENYYFKLKPHLPWLRKFLATHPRCAQPNGWQTELMAAALTFDNDLCISRPKTRVRWGITLPFDDKYVTYVWFDALLNYLSFQPGDVKNVIHVIGKDILAPSHGIYWLIMLHVLNTPDNEVPSFVVHGWWLTPKGDKASKSAGNSDSVLDLIDKYGVNMMRFGLFYGMTPGNDATWDEERMIELYNGVLVNKVGNLIHRVLSMVHKYSAGKICQPPKWAELVKPILRLHGKTPYTLMLDGIKMAEVINTEIEEYKPWEKAKDPAKANELSAKLYAMVQGVRMVGYCLWPVLPKLAEELAYLLNVATLEEPLGSEVKTPVILLPRITYESPHPQ